MKIVLISLASILSFFAVTIEADTIQDPTTSINLKPHKQIIAPNTFRLNDGQIAEILLIENTNEIKAAKLVAKKTANPYVRGFAHLMIVDHTADEKQLDQLVTKNHIDLIPSRSSFTLVKENKNELLELNSMDNHELDVTYITKIIKGHISLLKTIDNVFLPMAINP